MRPVEDWEENYKPKEFRFELRLRSIDHQRMEKLRKKMASSDGKIASRATVVRTALEVLSKASERRISLKELPRFIKVIRNTTR